MQGVRQSSSWTVLAGQPSFSSSSAGQQLVKLGFVGAGGINFGTPEGPWNHAARLEKLPGIDANVVDTVWQIRFVSLPFLVADVVFTSIVDPNTALAHQRIDELQKGKFADKWRETKVFKDYRDLLNSPVILLVILNLPFALRPRFPSVDRFHLQERPDALFIGLPPSYHGSIDNPKADIELQLAKVVICRPSSDQRQESQAHKPADHLEC